MHNDLLKRSLILTIFLCFCWAELKVKYSILYTAVDNFYNCNFSSKPHDWCHNSTLEWVVGEWGRCFPNEIQNRSLRCRWTNLNQSEPFQYIPLPNYPCYSIGPRPNQHRRCPYAKGKKRTRSEEDQFMLDFEDLIEVDTIGWKHHIEILKNKWFRLYDSNRLFASEVDDRSYFEVFSMRRRRFDIADVNRDGKLTLAEFLSSAVFMNATEPMFRVLDYENDGYLDKQKFERHHPRIQYNPLYKHYYNDKPRHRDEHEELEAKTKDVQAIEDYELILD